MSPCRGTEFLTLCSNVVAWPLVALKAQQGQITEDAKTRMLQITELDLRFTVRC